MNRGHEESWIDCPYCWESICVLLNPEDLGENYIEDCQVCCQPIEFFITQDGLGELKALVSADSE